MKEKFWKNYKFWLIIFLLIIVFMGGYYYFSHKANSEVERIISIVEKQSKLESNLSASGYTFDNPNIVLDPYENAPLSALVMFETDREEEVTITVVGKDELSTFEQTFEAAKEHYIPVYGLYADTLNEVVIKVGEKKKTINIQTDPLPENFILPTKVKAEKDKLTNDLYFFTPSSVGYTCAYDVNGDVRWYLSSYALWKVDRLENGHLMLSTERPVNSPYYMTGMYEMDLLGKVYNEYSLRGGYHHDYFEMENGNFLIASDEFNNADGTVEDIVVEMDRETGKIVKTFDLKDVLNMEDGKSASWINYDWFHNNSVWYDKATNSITLSGRHKDAVINIDYETGELNWIIGDPTNWNEEYQKYFFKPVGDGEFEWQWSQHAAMITPEGYVFILDNGNNKSKIESEYVKAEDSYTRGVMYKIDTEKMTIEQVWEYGKERGSDYYSPYISDVDYLAKNHYIVHSGGISYKDGIVQNEPAGLAGADELKSITTELLNDKVIFEITLPTNNYRVEKMPVYVGNDYALGKAEIKGDLGETKVDSEHFGLLLNINKIDKEYENHNITFNKEYDRLVFKGQFKKGTDVKLYLVDGLKSNIYNVSVSKKPYTALCVDIFTEEENENGIVVTKYINEVNLKGKYKIYVEIEGKLYNTEEYVEF